MIAVGDVLNETFERELSTWLTTGGCRSRW